MPTKRTIDICGLLCALALVAFIVSPRHWYRPPPSSPKVVVENTRIMNTTAQPHGMNTTGTVTHLPSSGLNTTKTDTHHSSTSAIETDVRAATGLNTQRESQSFHYKCHDSEPFAIDNSQSSVFHMKRVHIEPAPSADQAAKLTIENANASDSRIRSEYDACRHKMNFQDRVDAPSSPHMPKLNLASEPQEDICGGKYLDGTVVFIIEFNVGSIYHIMLDYALITYHTLEHIGLESNITNTQIVVMANVNIEHQPRIQPFYDTLYTTVFGKIPMWNDQIRGCFSDVVVGIYFNRRVMYDITMFNTQRKLFFAPEMVGSVRRFRKHILNRLDIDDDALAQTHAVDTILIARRPMASGRWLINEQQFLRECEQHMRPHKCRLIELGNMSIRDQIMHVRNAVAIVGVEGSAMHMGFFGPPGQIVIIIRHPLFPYRFVVNMMQYLEAERTSIEWMGVVERGGVLANPLIFRFLITNIPAVRASFPDLNAFGLREVWFSDLEEQFVAFAAQLVATRNNELIFTTGNSYLVWWQHLVAHLKVVGRLQNTIFVVLNEAECEAMWEAGIVCFQDRSTWSKEIVETGKNLGRYGLPVIIKWLYAQRFVALRYTTMFMDSDVALLRDPFLLVDARYDIMTQSNLDPTCAPCADGRFGICHNSGLMVFEPTKKTLNVLTHATNQLHTTPELWEQEMFNIVLAQFLPPPWIDELDWSSRCGGNRSWSIRRPTADDEYVHYRHLYDHQAANCLNFKYTADTRNLKYANQEIVVLHLNFVKAPDKEETFKQYGVFMGNRPYSDPRYPVEQGIDLLLRGQTIHPEQLCHRVDGIWALPDSNFTSPLPT